MAEALLTIRLEYADFLEEDAEMVALLRRALALLPPGDSAIRARLEGFLAQEAFSSVPDRERRAMIGRAVAMARRVRDPMALAAVLTSHSWIVAGPESVSERLAVADELVAVGREAGLPYAECDGQQWRMLALIELGEVEAVDAALAAAHAAVRTTKSRWTVGFLDTVRALLAGRFADAEAAVARGREAARETTAPQALAESAFVRLLSCVRIVQGRLTEYESAREAMAEGITNLPPTFFVVRSHAARERHDRDRAREAFERALSKGLLEQPRGPTWLISLTWAADICAWLEDGPRALLLLDLLAPFSSAMTWQYGAVGRVVGLLELDAGTRGRGRAPAARRRRALRAHGRTSLPRHGAPRPRRAAGPGRRGPPAPRPSAHQRRPTRHARPHQSGTRSPHIAAARAGVVARGHGPIQAASGQGRRLRVAPTCLTRACRGEIIDCLTQ